MKMARYMGWFWLLVPLAVLGFAAEALDWSHNGESGSLLRPLWFGLFCAFGFMLAAWLKVAQAARKAEAAQELLASVLDTLDVGLEIWDREDRLLLYNQQINRLRIDLRTPEDIGKPFASLMRAKLAQRQIVAAIGREDEWLANLLQTRGSHTQPQLKEYTGDQWFRIHEQRTAGGFVVTSWVDVTELVRKERQLQDHNALLQRQTSMDALTGLANRRRFDEVLAIELHRAERSTIPISLLMIDIDYFKQYNDHYGHVAGDECLQAVADVLLSCVRRAGEMVARYGGEEFVLLLPGSDQEHALEVAQKCLDQLRLQAIAHKGAGPDALLSVSIGVASTAAAAGLSAASFLNAADAAMYHAKTAGRARYEVATQADWNITRDTPRTTPGELRQG